MYGPSGKAGAAVYILRVEEGSKREKGLRKQKSFLAETNALALHRKLVNATMIVLVVLLSYSLPSYQTIYLYMLKI